MKKVIYRPIKPLKKNQADIVEFTEADVDSIKLRALALNWIVISISEVI